MQRQRQIEDKTERRDVNQVGDSQPFVTPGHVTTTTVQLAAYHCLNSVYISVTE